MQLRRKLKRKEINLPAEVDDDSFLSFLLSYWTICPQHKMILHISSGFMALQISDHVRKIAVDRINLVLPRALLDMIAGQ